MSGEPRDLNLELYTAIKANDISRIRQIFVDGKAHNEEIMNMSVK